MSKAKTAVFVHIQIIFTCILLSYCTFVAYKYGFEHQGRGTKELVKNTVPSSPVSLCPHAHRSCHHSSKLLIYSKTAIDVKCSCRAVINCSKAICKHPKVSCSLIAIRQKTHLHFFCLFLCAIV